MLMNKNDGKLPDFIVCGFQKCATTALKENLPQHPKIYIPTTNHEICRMSQGKEFNFFRPSDTATTWHLGLDWYKSNFPNDNRVCGEISPNYSWDANVVAKKMHEHHPNVKIIFTLRNPIDRAHSAYNMYKQMYPHSKNWGNWDNTKSFTWNLKNTYSFNINYLETLLEYKNYFSDNQVLYTIQEQLKNDPAQEYNKIFSFLGVSHFEINNKEHHVRNDQPKLSDNERSECKDILLSDVNKLFDWLGYEIKEWKEFC